MDRYFGHVKVYYQRKGYGFIRGEKTPSMSESELKILKKAIYFYYKNYKGAPKKGAYVSFKVVANKRKKGSFEAIHIREKNLENIVKHVSPRYKPRIGFRDRGVKKKLFRYSGY